MAKELFPLALRPPELAAWAAVVLLGCLWAFFPHTVSGAGCPACSTAWRLNVNTASLEELETLPGLGARRARMIVESRSKRGDFASVSELARVRGFSKALVKRLEPLLRAEAR